MQQFPRNLSLRSCCINTSRAKMCTEKHKISTPGAWSFVCVAVARQRDSWTDVTASKLWSDTLPHLKIATYLLPLLSKSWNPCQHSELCGTSEKVTCHRCLLFPSLASSDPDWQVDSESYWDRVASLVGGGHMADENRWGGDWLHKKFTKQCF